MESQLLQFAKKLRWGRGKSEPCSNNIPIFILDVRSNKLNSWDIGVRI